MTQSQRIDIDLLELSPLRRGKGLPRVGQQDVEVADRTGILREIVARPLPGTRPQRYEIVEGVREWLIAQQAKFQSVWVRVDPYMDDAEAQALALKDAGAEPDPITRARATQAYLQANPQVSLTKYASQLGVKRTTLAHELRLLKLPADMQALVQDGTLRVGDARVLVNLGREDQRKIAQRAANGQLLVREVERLAKASREGWLAQALSGAAPPKDPNLERLENGLGEILGSAVSINYEGAGQGEMRIAFHDLDVLDGILARLGYRVDP